MQNIYFKCFPYHHKTKPASHASTIPFSCCHSPCSAFHNFLHLFPSKAKVLHRGAHNYPLERAYYMERSNKIIPCSFIRPTMLSNLFFVNVNISSLFHLCTFESCSWAICSQALSLTHISLSCCPFTSLSISFTAR